MIIPDVLVVDDDASTRELTCQWLEDAGYGVDMLSRAEEALLAVRDCAPSVVVTNVQLPDHDGLWLARQIRAASPDTAFVFVSNDPTAGPVVARAGIGAFDYLGTPIAASTLIEAVERGSNWHEARSVRRRQTTAADSEQAAPLWSYDADTNTLTQHADWLPSPLAVSRLVTDLLLDRPDVGGQPVSVVPNFPPCLPTTGSAIPPPSLGDRRSSAPAPNAPDRAPRAVRPRS